MGVRDSRYTIKDDGGLASQENNMLHVHKASLQVGPDILCVKAHQDV